MKRNYLPGPVVKVNGIVPKEKGGTDADNAPQALANLGLVASSRIGNPDGPVPINPVTGLIDSSYFNVLFSNSVEVAGPEILDLNEVATYKITNYDSRLIYNLAADYGTVSIVGDTITYTAPNVSGVTGGFLINGESYPVTLNSIERPPNTPSIIIPSADVNSNVSSISFISSDWGTIYVDDSHYSTDWQVALDAGFTTISQEVLDVVSQKTTFTLTGIEPGMTFYVRVRYKGILGSYSEWSAARIVARPSDLRPMAPTITVPSADGDLSSNAVTFNTSDFVGVSPGDTHLETEWQTAADPAFLTDANSITSQDTYLRTYPKVLTAGVSLYVRVRFKGANDSSLASNWSLTRRVRYVEPIAPNQPVITSPDTNTVIGVTSVTIQASAFVETLGGELHTTSDWERATDELFTQNVVQYYGDAVNKTTREFTGLVFGTTYYFRVRYNSDAPTTSDWSLPRQVLVSSPEKPTISSPFENETGISTEMNVVGSDFTMLGGSSTHLNSDWEFSLSNTFDIIEHNSYNDSAHLTIYPRSNLVVNTAYYVRVRYRSASGFTSSWSDPRKFTTVASNYASSEIAFINSDEVGYANMVTMDSSGERLCVSRSTDAKIYRLTPSGLVVELNVTNNHVGLDGVTYADAGRGYMSINPAGNKACQILGCNPQSYFSGTSLHNPGDVTIKIWDRSGNVWGLTSTVTLPLVTLFNASAPEVRGKYESNRYIGFKTDGTWFGYFTYINTSKGVSQYDCVAYSDGLTLYGELRGFNGLNYDRCNFANFAGVTSQVISHETFGGNTGIFITEATVKHFIASLPVSSRGASIMPRYITASANGKKLAYYDENRRGVVVLG